MKIALLFYHSVYDDEVRGLLERLGCGRYVEVPRAWARDGSDRRFDTHIFPGTDSLILAFLDEACAAGLLEAVRLLQGQRAKEHTHVAVVAVEAFV